MLLKRIKKIMDNENPTMSTFFYYSYVFNFSVIKVVKPL